MPIRNKAFILSFPAVSSVSRPDRYTGYTFSSGSAKISKDGGAFSNTTNLPVEISAGRYSLTLTATEMNADFVHVYVESSGIDPVDFQVATSGHPSGAVIASPSPTSTVFGTDRTEATTDYWKDALIMFTSGALAGQVKKVSAYDGTTKAVTVSSAFTAAPASTDRFILVNL